MDQLITCTSCKREKPAPEFLSKTDVIKKQCDYCRASKRRYASRRYHERKVEAKYHEPKETTQEILHRREKHKLWIEANWDRALLSACVHMDRQKGVESDLDLPFLYRMLGEQSASCAHCGTTMVLGRGSHNADQISVDRVDNTKGHCKGNVVLSCFRCNLERKDTDFEAFGTDLLAVIAA